MSTKYSSYIPMSPIPDLLHPELSAVAHCAPSPDCMYPDVLFLSPRKYEKHTVKTVLYTTLIKRLRDIPLRLRKVFGDGIKYKVVYEARLRLI
jgi:hypothetical protein